MKFVYLSKDSHRLKEIKSYGFLMVSEAKYWPQRETALNLQLHISRDSIQQSLTACYNNASSVRMTLHWIPNI